MEIENLVDSIFCEFESFLPQIHLSVLDELHAQVRIVTIEKRVEIGDGLDRPLVLGFVLYYVNELLASELEPVDRDAVEGILQMLKSRYGLREAS